jgi:hypothetical protein
MLDETFPMWMTAQREAERLALETPPPPSALRAIGRLEPARAARIARWFTGQEPVPSAAVRASYRALEEETAALFGALRDGLGVRVELAWAPFDPYDDAAALCADLRDRRTMMLRTIACDPPHPLLGGEAGGIVDQLRVVHDVFGHAALGLGFDLQSEYATWLQCRTLFTAAARPAAFCELVGAVTAYVMTGMKPPLRADLPPRELLSA